MTEALPLANSASALVPEQAGNLSRRSFIRLTSATAFILGFYVPLRRTSEAVERKRYVPNGFIKIDQQGEVTLIPRPAHRP
jgi:hypothetical protein